MKEAEDDESSSPAPEGAPTELTDEEDDEEVEDESPLAEEQESSDDEAITEGRLGSSRCAPVLPPPALVVALSPDPPLDAPAVCTPPSLIHLRKGAELYRFFTAFSVRPGSSLAISFHLTNRTHTHHTHVKH